MEGQDLAKNNNKILSEDVAPTKTSAKSQLDACTAQCLKDALKTTVA